MKTSTLSRRYGWRPDTPDARDYRYRAPRRVLEALPPMVDLTSVCPPVYDQTTLGSCTGNAIGSAHQFEQIKQLLSGTDAVAIVAAITQSFIPSRLFIYWNERDMEGSVGYDAGAEIRDGIKSVVNQGVCPESMWPYDISKFRDKPPEACYTDAMNHQVVVYQRIDQTLEQLKGSLAAGYPVVFGFSVYESFETNEVARTGEAPMPKAGESLLGGHAVKLVGYNDAIQRWKVKNSWGCYSDDTEVLTERGWLLFKDTTDDDFFFTRNPLTGTIETHRRKKYFEYPFDGELFHFTSTKIDVLVTPNHNMYLKTNAGKMEGADFSFIRAENLSDSPMYWFSRTGEWMGVERKTFSLPSYVNNDGKCLREVVPIEYKMDDWLEFFGYWIAEGSISVSRCKRGGHEFRVSISQKKPNIREKIYACVSRLGFRAYKCKNSIDVANKQLYLYLKNFGKCDAKYIPHELKQLSQRQLRILFNALMLGDGSSVMCKNGSYRSTYYTSSRRLATDVQEICLKMGLATTENIDDRRGKRSVGGNRYNFVSYQVRVHGLQSRDARQTRVARSGVNRERYCGMVYCVEVPNHLLYVRRNGKSCWCGNSGWGDKGYFTLPYEYLTNSDLSADFWNISLVEMSSDDIHDVPTPTPNPQPNFPCDLSLVFPAAKAFVDGAVKGAMRSTERTQTDRMIESGFVELQAYLQRVENIRNRQK